MAALSHLRVLDLTDRIAGPCCTKLMAGFGAEVVKIERPGSGDSLRSTGPFLRGREGLERSIPFHWYNTGKKSVTVDLKTEQGAEICKRLVIRADIVVESFGPGVMARLGLGYETLKALKPALVLTSISNFGQTGPYRDYQAEEITEYAMSGAMHATGDPRRAPLAAGPAIAHVSAGMKAYIATLMAHLRTVQTGVGTWIDLSVHEAALDNVEIALAEFLHLGKPSRRTNDEHALVPWQTYPCRDGRAAIIGGPIRRWLPGAQLFEEPELTGGEYDHMSKRIANRQRIGELMAPWLRSKRKKEIFHAGQSHGLAFSYVASLQEVLESPQHDARGFFVPTECADAGRPRMAGAPFIASETPWRQSRAPSLGEHTEAILKEWLRLPEDEIARLRGQAVV